jgi:asparagine synthase (glutamine-hydrolysing)
MPIQFVVLDDQKWFEEWDREGFRFPEPMINAPLWNEEECVRKAALNDGIRVFYSGWGPDSLLSEPTQYLTLLRHGYIAEITRLASDFVIRYRRRPLAAIGRCWRKLWGIASERRADIEALALLAPSIKEQVEIPNGWWQFSDQPQRHPWRPRTYSQLTNHYWTLGFQQYDAANRHAPVEFRYPYFDTRLVRYLLRVPVLPCFSDKGLLRQAMCGRLPESVRMRPKTLLASDPKHCYAAWVHRDNRPGARLARYVDTSRVLRLGPGKGGEGATLAHRLIALNHWLERCEQTSTWWTR